MLPKSQSGKIIFGQPFPFPPLDDGRVYLSCEGNVTRPIHLKIISAGGNMICQSTHCLPNHGGTMELKLPKLLPGKYELQIICGECIENKVVEFRVPKKLQYWGNFFQRFFNLSGV